MIEDSDIPDPEYEKTYSLLPELGKLREVLRPLSMRHRLAFALCCCERLYPSYRALAGLIAS